MLKALLWRLLGEQRYSSLRGWVRAGCPLRGRLAADETYSGGDWQDIASRFKAHVIESIARRRALERDVAELRYPGLFKTDLDVVAEFSSGGKESDSWAGSATVIITNFNYGRYVGRAVESVLAQTHKGVELVVVDDASTDGSVDALSEVLAPISSVRWQLLRLKHNVGLAVARNLGIQLSRSEFVFTLDADNHLLRNCIEAHVRAAQESDADAVYGMVGTFGTASRLLSDGPFSAQKLARGPYIDAMALFRRSALVESGLYSTDLALYGWEDYELWVRFAAEGRPATFVPTVLSHYRFHRQNMISVASLDTRRAWLYLFGKHRTIFGDMSVAEREAEAARRSRAVAETGLRAWRSESGSVVDCGCDGVRLLVERDEIRAR